MVMRKDERFRLAIELEKLDDSVRTIEDNQGNLRENLLAFCVERQSENLRCVPENDINIAAGLRSVREQLDSLRGHEENPAMVAPPEPWYSGGDFVKDDNGNLILRLAPGASPIALRRLAMCVNALAGVPDEILETIVIAPDQTLFEAELRVSNILRQLGAFINRPTPSPPAAPEQDEIAF